MAITEAIEGIGFRLRCVTEDDATAALALRNDPELSRYLPPLKVTVQQQRDWIAKQRERPMEYYFAVENKANGRLSGLSSLYGYEEKDGRRLIEWGRFVVAQGSFAAPETSLLTHQFAFETLKLDEVYGFSVEANEPIQSFHHSSKLEDRGQAAATYEIDGVTYTSRCYALVKENWPSFRDHMTVGARQAARFASRLP